MDQVEQWITAGAGRFPTLAALSATSIVVSESLLGLAPGGSAGFRWFLGRSLLTVPILLGWWAQAGRDRRRAAPAGGLTLVLMRATRSRFLGPLRLFGTLDGAA